MIQTADTGLQARGGFLIPARVCRLFQMGGDEDMSKKSYSELLQDPRWQRLRLETLNAADWKCSECGVSDKTLHVHHRQYFKGRAPWEYQAHELAVLCHECHEVNHEALERLKHALVPLQSEQIEAVEGYAAAQRMWGDWTLRLELRMPDHATGVADAFSMPIEILMRACDETGSVTFESVMEAKNQWRAESAKGGQH